MRVRGAPGLPQGGEGTGGTGAAVAVPPLAAPPGGGGGGVVGDRDGGDRSSSDEEDRDRDREADDPAAAAPPPPAARAGPDALDAPGNEAAISLRLRDLVALSSTSDRVGSLSGMGSPDQTPIPPPPAAAAAATTPPAEGALPSSLPSRPSSPPDVRPRRNRRLGPPLRPIGPRLGPPVFVVAVRRYRDRGRAAAHSLGLRPRLRPPPDRRRSRGRSISPVPRRPPDAVESGRYRYAVHHRRSD